MMDKQPLIVAGTEVPTPEGVTVRNYRDGEACRFGFRDRSGLPVTELVLHETVTRSAKKAISVLQQRELGVHLLVAPNGVVTQHGDLAHDRLAHAGGHNGPSVGIEVVNPYYPKYAGRDVPWTQVITAPWAHKGRYVVPTLPQAEATAQLVGLLTSGQVPGISIPRTWLGLSGDNLAMGRLDHGNTRTPGVYAHCYFQHADGAWLVLYAWLRLEAGLMEADAYREAVQLASGARRKINLSNVSRLPLRQGPTGASMDTMKRTTVTPELATLEAIAKRELRIETLKTRKSDSLDFHEVAVWSLKAALEAAFQAGIDAARSKGTRSCT